MTYARYMGSGIGNQFLPGRSGVAGVRSTAVRVASDSWRARSTSSGIRRRAPAVRRPSQLARGATLQPLKADRRRLAFRPGRRRRRRTWPVPVPDGAAGAGGPRDRCRFTGTSTSCRRFSIRIWPSSGIFRASPGPIPWNRRRPSRCGRLRPSFQAVVDPYARADFFVAFGAEGAELKKGT